MNENQQAHTDIAKSTLLPVIKITKDTDVEILCEVLKDDEVEYTLHLARDIDQLASKYTHVYELVRYWGAEATDPKAGVAFVGQVPGSTDKENLTLLSRYLFALRMDGTHVHPWVREVLLDSENYGTANKPKEIEEGGAIAVLNVVDASDTQMRVEVLRDGKVEHLLHFAKNIHDLTDYYKHVYSLLPGLSALRFTDFAGDPITAGVAFASAAPGFTDKENGLWLTGQIEAMFKAGVAPGWVGLPNPTYVNCSGVGKREPKAPSSLGGMLERIDPTRARRNEVKDDLVQVARDAGLLVREVELNSEDILHSGGSAGEMFGALFGSGGQTRTEIIREDINLTIQVKSELVSGLKLKILNNRGMFRPMYSSLHVCPTTMRFAVPLLKALGQAKTANEANRIWGVFSLFMTDDHLEEDNFLDLEVYIDPETLQFYLLGKESGTGLLVEPFSELLYVLPPSQTLEILRETEGDCAARMQAFQKLEGGELCLRRRKDLMKVSTLLVAMVNDANTSLELCNIFSNMENMF